MGQKNKLIIAMVMVLLVVTGGIFALKNNNKQGNNQQNGNQNQNKSNPNNPHNYGVEKAALQGQLSSSILEGMVLGLNTTVTQSSVTPFSEGNQYKAELLSDSSMKELYEAYISYLEKEGYRITDRLINDLKARVVAEKGDQSLLVSIANTDDNKRVIRLNNLVSKGK